MRGWRDRADSGPRSALRRAPGLRRGELAARAGISLEYLLRLEQGRATNPSAHVVAALARALALTPGERDRLYRAAGLLPPQDATVGTHLPPGIRRVTARLIDVPMGVFSADWTLLHWNPMWVALHGDPAAFPAEARNLASVLFGSVTAGAFRLPSWSTEGRAAFEADLVADLRQASDRYPADAGLAALVAGLRRTSAVFEGLWGRVGASAMASDVKTFRHPAAGDLTLDCDVLTVPGADLRIVSYTAEPGSPDAAKLQTLADRPASPR
ncbi:helix-turn-helix domain-containing protein [Catenuloplanes sp. NPDC051500]|uniref:helix-turn-helix domain-containing protein n=1 Tax=Catenuloplanes sp. NPDC051500 TaxID=3363959 RepID=UPI0037B4DFE0